MTHNVYIRACYNCEESEGRWVRGDSRGEEER
jgi:hypothetical protein